MDVEYLREKRYSLLFNTLFAPTVYLSLTNTDYDLKAPTTSKRISLRTLHANSVDPDAADGTYEVLDFYRLAQVRLTCTFIALLVHATQEPPRDMHEAMHHLQPFAVALQSLAVASSAAKLPEMKWTPNQLFSLVEEVTSAFCTFVVIFFARVCACLQHFPSRGHLITSRYYC